MPKGDADNLRADLDDGYTGIANLLVEAMACCPFTSTEYAVLLFIIRRTYGWAKAKDRATGKLDQMSAEEIAQGTASPRRTVERAIANLKRAHVIIHEQVGAANVMAYGMNPNVAEWGLPTAEWAWAKTQLREARDAGAYTQKCVYLYAEKRTPVRENAYTCTQNCVQGQAPNVDTERVSGSLHPVVQPYIQPENDSPPTPQSCPAPFPDPTPQAPDGERGGGGTVTRLNVPEATPAVGRWVDADGTPHDRGHELQDHGELREAVRKATSEKLWSQAQRDGLTLFLAQAAEDPATEVDEKYLVQALGHMPPTANERRLPEKYLDRVLRERRSAVRAARASPGSVRRTQHASPASDFEGKTGRLKRT